VFVPTPTDVGGVLQLTETATNAGGAATAVSAFAGPVTDPTKVVPVPTATSLPTISGTAQEGSVLTASSGGWTENPGTFTYQWLRCARTCAAISGANTSSYSPTAGDVGSSVAVEVTAGNGGGTSGTVQSAKSTTVTTPTSTSLLADPSVLVADQGVTLTATVTSGTSSVPPSGGLSFTDNGTPIKGCTNLPMQPAGQTGTITCQTAFVASTARVGAAYSPPSGSLATGSSSPVVTFVVGRAKAHVTVSGASHPGLRTKTTFTVKVGSPGGSTTGVTPSGIVRFMDGTRTIRGCSHLRLRRLTASCTVRYTGLATHRIVGAYLGDANFQPTNSAVRTVTVAPLRPTGFVTALMGWTFHYTAGYTTVTQLDAGNLSPGMRISLGCQGSGCPFGNRQVHLGPHASCSASAGGCSLDLLPLLHGARLRPGATLTIRITHSMWIGKYYRFVILPGQRPQQIQACLAANSDRPGVGCTGV
jgi:hypothetical protein